MVSVSPMLTGTCVNILGGSLKFF